MDFEIERSKLELEESIADKELKIEYAKKAIELREKDIDILFDLIDSIRKGMIEGSLKDVIDNISTDLDEIDYLKIKIKNYESKIEDARNELSKF